MKKMGIGFIGKIAKVLAVALVIGCVAPGASMVAQAAVDPHQAVVNPTPISDSTMNSGRRVTYDTVFLGTYPQSEVKASDPVYEKLQNATGWNICGDVMVEGVKYRRIKQSDAVGCTLDLETWYYDEETDSYITEQVEPGIGADGYSHWENQDTYHYFRFDPIRWRVLDVDGDKALLLSDIAIDARATDVYEWSRPADSEDVRTIDGVVYSSISSAWDNCVLRSWLNSYGSSKNYYKVNCAGNGEKSFYNVAFSSAEKRAILTTPLRNEGGKTAFHSYDGPEYTVGGRDTNDKVFLLSYDDVIRQYGFANSEETKDEAKTCNISDYAISLGLYGESDDGAKPRDKWSVQWGLRTSTDGVSFWYGSDGYAAVAKDGSRFVWKNNDGSIYRYGDWVGRLQGVRPAMMINLSSSAYTYAGTVCTDGTYSDGTEYTLAGCEEGHLLDHVEAVEPTYEKAGHEEYWICRRCGKLFADEAGTTETTYFDLAIPKLVPATPAPEPVQTREPEETSVPEQTGSPNAAATETPEASADTAVSTPEPTEAGTVAGVPSTQATPTVSPSAQARSVATVAPTESPAAVPTVRPVATASPARTPAASSSGSGSGYGSGGGAPSGGSSGSGSSGGSSGGASGGSAGGSGSSGTSAGDLSDVPAGATATPLPTATPVPEASVMPSVAPQATQAPVMTETPVSVSAPEVSATPAQAYVPDASAAPSATIPEEPAAKVAGVTYSVSGSSVVVSSISNRKCVTIKKRVRIGGRSYKVTAIKKKLFKGHGKVYVVTVDASFIKSVGKQAFDGIAEDAVIRLKGSKARKRKVKRLILKSGVGKGVSISM